MALIDILISVNGEQLAAQIRDGSIKPGTVDSPTNLGSYSSSDVFISMVTQDNYISNEQGQSELTVKANSGDTVRWTMTTFDENTDNTAFLYADKFNPATGITSLSYFNMHTSLYLPSSSDPKSGNIELYHNNTYVAQGTVIEPGQTIQYTLSFKLVDNSTGDVIGYFTWDPFIKVAA
ncbi:MAG: inclusion body family protein [Kangiellaceae bacterium]|nr:inclusion body family protein [Kangiellaceae bacterium]MCW8998357.1 inclusion body family protein [Kangiellaceae bacterium]MCW9016726.1 inclusion body family protein [Kangiellaceae bacterium]